MNSYTAGIFDIEASQQLEDATVSVETGVFELKSQRTFVSEKDIQTGKEMTIEISVADVGNIPLLATALATEVVGTGADESLIIKDDSGLEFPYRRLLILPYAGASPTSDRKRWIFCPQVQLRATVNLTFGLETQQAFTIMVMPKADENDVKFVTGSQIFTLYPGVPVPDTTGGGGGGGVTTFNTTLTSTSATAASVTMVGATAGTEFRFNSIAGVTGTAISMDVFVAGTQRAAINTLTGYVGQQFRFLYTGTLYRGTFANGTVNVVVA